MLKCFSHVQLFVTPWTMAHHSPLSMGFSRQEYWSGLPCLPPGDCPHPGIEHLLWLLHWQVSSLSLGPPGKPNTSAAHSSCYLESELYPTSHRHIHATPESMLIWQIQAKVIIELLVFKMNF